ncbi:MAG: hypothetical protein MUE85_01895 [Microscillaceae bacterium]|jgi:hypothetical protein|nr:hypothetical protein [Microscillaceae bacterium]
MSLITIIGFHGTNSLHFKDIKTNNFNPSLGDVHWLGDGIYFFVEGVSDPVQNAENWAKASAWNNNTGNYTYQSYVVIKAEIVVDKSKFLDLTTLEGIEIFNYLRNKFVEKIVSGKKRLKIGQFNDGHIINLARKNNFLDIEVVKGNFYIKFTPERIYDINFRTPNCTIIAVNSPKININTITINIEKEGEV